MMMWHPEGNVSEWDSMVMLYASKKKTYISMMQCVQWNDSIGCPKFLALSLHLGYNSWSCKDCGTHCIIFIVKGSLWDNDLFNMTFFVWLSLFRGSSPFLAYSVWEWISIFDAYLLILSTRIIFYYVGSRVSGSNWLVSDQGGSLLASPYSYLSRGLQKKNGKRGGSWKEGGKYWTKKKSEKS